MKWPLTNIVFTSAYLQTGGARRDVYVVPPKESEDRSKLWLLLTAAYGLVNAGAKWQEHADSSLLDLGLTQLKYVPQVFFQLEKSTLNMIAVKVVDDVLFAGQREYVDSIVNKIKRSYELGTVVHGPGSFMFFGLSLTQEEDMTITIHADLKMKELEGFPISRS